MSFAKYDHDVKENARKAAHDEREFKYKVERDHADANEKREHNHQVMRESHRTRLTFAKSDYMTDIVLTKTGWAFSTGNTEFPAIRNVGVGPAIDVTVVFHEDRVNRIAISGRATKATASPMQIAANCDGDVRFLPDVIQADVNRLVKSVEGKIVLKCKHRDGTVGNESYNYEIRTCYDQRPPHVHLTIREN